MTIRTEEELSDKLAEDLIWRKKEMTILRKLVATATPDRKTVLLRSLIAILYAHWEGFIKNASNAYLEYVANRRLLRANLASNFLANSLARRIHDASDRRNLSSLIEVIELLRGNLQSRSRMPKERIVTESNLSSRVLEDVTTLLGIDYKPYQMKAVLIDESLVGNRNQIAHGDYLAVDESTALALLDEIQQLMESFRDQIENAVALGAYRAST